MKEIIIDDGNVVNSTDWENKYKEVINFLNEKVFFELNKISNEKQQSNKKSNWKKINADEYRNMLEDEYYNNSEEQQSSQIKGFKKNDIMPLLTPMQVTSALNRILRKYRPMNLDEAKRLEDIEYLDAFGYYCDVISYINKYLVYLPDKQTFCAFVNITTDVYNEMLGNPNYSSVFNSFEDSFIQSNFSSAQAGIVDGKTTVAKLQTKNAGHNLIKNPDSVTFNITQKIDKQKVNQMLGKYESIAKIGKK